MTRYILQVFYLKYGGSRLRKHAMQLCLVQNALELRQVNVRELCISISTSEPRHETFIKHSISSEDATNRNVTLYCAHVVEALLSRGSWQRFRDGIIDSKIIVSPSKAELSKAFTLTPSNTGL